MGWLQWKWHAGSRQIPQRFRKQFWRLLWASFGTLHKVPGKFTSICKYSFASSSRWGSPTWCTPCWVFHVSFSCPSLQNQSYVIFRMYVHTYTYITNIFGVYITLWFWGAKSWEKKGLRKQLGLKTSWFWGKQKNEKSWVGKVVGFEKKTRWFEERKAHEKSWESSWVWKTKLIWGKQSTKLQQKTKRFWERVPERRREEGEGFGEPESAENWGGRSQRVRKG